MLITTTKTNFFEIKEKKNTHSSKKVQDRKKFI